MGNNIFNSRLSINDVLHNKTIENQLVEAGISSEESKAITWLINQHQYGKTVGLVGGVFTAYTWGHWVMYVYPRLKLLSQLAIVAGFVWTGDYFFTARRWGANHYMSNVFMLNNNLFLKNKQEFTTNFNVLNRKFTPEEIQCFNDKREHLNQPNRKWIFNPHVYEPQEFLDKVQRVQSKTAPWKDPRIVQKIKEANQEKEHLELEPFKATKRFDQKGIKHDVRLSLNYGWSPLAKSPEDE